ncbi:hypothetical protein EA756_15835 [Acinetobacter lactucae]|uniref:Uncharacterized protein n=1 Tax=Acinetobacter lactucae TaxID=1785128 RepID=A0A429JUB3_9GAMM|nr:hypothetical protein [Acinetobacter lactucae]RSO53612.1 hypothetical protein EA756_15835 [Acinetobacter lactucae]
MAISLNLPIYPNVYFWCFFKQKNFLREKIKLRKLWLIF